jgi:hypothetical protein
MIILLTGAVGSGRTQLAAFDAALVFETAAWMSATPPVGVAA